jgi:hypothetical protein
MAGSGAARVKLSENSHQAAYRAEGRGFSPTRAIRGLQFAGAAHAVCAPAAKAVGSRRLAYAAVVRHLAVVRSQPRGQSPIVGRFGRLDQNGFHQVLGVIGSHSNTHCATDWYRVQLPLLPNGQTGWVRVWAVRPYRVTSRIEVDVSERLLRVYSSGRLVVQSHVAVGAPATPTPLGRYFVNERYVLPDPSGPFGPAALGISAHSDVLRDVWVEDGPIGIHGTNEPWSIGRAASHGCIRVANGVMRRVFRAAPAGTPVIVKA